MDITNFMTWFISQFIGLFTWIFSLLQSIEFYGTNLLEFSLAFLILSVAISVLLGLVQSRSIQSMSKADRRFKSGGNNE